MPSYGPFPDLAAFSAWIAETTSHDDPYFYAVIDPEDRVLGMLALMAIRPEDRVCEIGGVLYSPALQRTPLSTEAQYLMARYAFETLGYRRYEWKCDSLNAASRRAAQRLGLTFEGIFRQHRIARARNRDSAWYSMLDSEWPARKANFERWLAPENFDAEGSQRASLSALNGGAG
jgi:RimJ/RimL family protein N-acetyltransferase